MAKTPAAQQTEPAATRQENPFLVASRLEITHILQAMMRDAALISVNADADNFFLTSLLAIDEHAGCMYLERGRDKAGFAAAHKNRTLSYSATLNKVQIRFTCGSIEATHYAGQEVYKVPLPGELLRIQRREYYRVPTPIVNPVKCRITAGEDTSDASVELNLSDIGCGGIAVQSPPALFTPVLGAYYSSVILLPGTAGLRMAIQSRNAFMVTLRNGKITQRCGFAFLDPTENTLATIQRYIMTLERQRRNHAARDG